MSDLFAEKNQIGMNSAPSEQGQTSIFSLKLWNFVVKKFVDSKCFFHLNQPVRVHSQIVFASLSQPCGSWVRFWYFCRGLDWQGRGIGGFQVSTILEIFDIKRSTLYEWLRDGKKFGAFRAWSIQAGELHFVLGGLTAVCLNLGLKDWGAVGDLSLESLVGLRQFRSEGAAIQIKRSQQASFNAARREVKHKEHRGYLAHYNNLIKLWEAKSQPHTPTGTGEIAPKAPYVLHINKKRIFVSRNFKAYGASQDGIAGEIGISSRSIRRYCEFLKIDHRQIVQSKGEYKHILGCLQHGIAPDYEPDHRPDVRLGFSEARGFYLAEQNSPAGYFPSYEVEKGRFFQIQQLDPESRWKFRQKTWINRCCIYRIDVPLRTMRASRRAFKRLGKLIGKFERPGGSTI